jgi:hypothetical protein
MRRAAAMAVSLEELATAAGHRVESAGTRPLLRYFTAARRRGMACHRDWPGCRSLLERGADAAGALAAVLGG